MVVSDFNIKIHGPYLSKLKIAITLIHAALWLTLSRDVDIEFDKIDLKAGKSDM
jgi:hypothetical protein